MEPSVPTISRRSSIWSVVSQAPDRLEDAGSPALEAIHHLPEIGMGRAAVLHGLRVGADGRGTAEPEHEVGAWTPSPMMGPILSSRSAPTQEGRFRRAYIETDFADAPPDRFLRRGVARIEAADVTVMKNPLAAFAAATIAVQSATEPGLGSF